MAKPNNQISNHVINQMKTLGYGSMTVLKSKYFYMFKNKCRSDLLW